MPTYLTNEVYVSVDVETDGPIPGVNSMLSIGAAAYRIEIVDGVPKPKLLGTFESNLQQLPEATQDPETMVWWHTQPKAWLACRINPSEPQNTMQAFVAWVRWLSGKPVFVGYPAGFDFLFVYWYIIRFLGPKSSPFSFSALDIKTFAMATLGTEYRESTKKNMPKNWFQETKHTHVAVEDAIEQGALFCNMLVTNREQLSRVAPF